MAPARPPQGHGVRASRRPSVMAWAAHVHPGVREERSWKRFGGRGLGVQPTNHLDLPAILWLQRYLGGLSGTTLLAVSHDRAFLNAVCNEMIVLRGGELTYHAGSYDEYVQVPCDGRNELCACPCFPQLAHSSQLWLSLPRS